MKYITKHTLFTLLFCTAFSTSSVLANINDDNSDIDEQIEETKSEALKQPLRRQLVSALPFSGKPTTTSKLKHIAQPGDMSSDRAKALIKLTTLVDTALSRGDIEQEELRESLDKGHYEALVS